MVKGTVKDLIAEFNRLRVRQAEIITEIGEAQREEDVEIVAVLATRLRIGDRVRITTTRASRPPRAAPTERDHTTTVTGQQRRAWTSSQTTVSTRGEPRTTYRGYRTRNVSDSRHGHVEHW